MPTYYATGVSASLAVCDLQSSLSNTFDLRQGDDQKNDVARMQKVFSSADRLRERAIGEDGSRCGIMRFIGAESDMPFYMVAAGATAYDTPNEQQTSERQEDAIMDDVEPTHESPKYSDGSPLTSLGATPTPTQQHFDHALTQREVVLPTVEQLSAPTLQDHTIETMLPDNVIYAHSDQQDALVLNVELSVKSFLPPIKKGGGPNATMGKDLKIEVFLNGQLADVNYINTRRSGASLTREKLYFAGTRIHRQVEKPWIYAPNRSVGLQSDGSKHESQAIDRMQAICAALLTEAETRGRDRFGRLSPSGDYLEALAGVQLPDQYRNHCGIGILDLLITAGKGRKYGPETAYLKEPTRMDDSKYKKSNRTQVLSLESEMRNSPEVVVLDDLHSTLEDPFLSTSSPEVPLNVQRDLFARSPSKQKTAELARELGLEIDPKKTFVGGYETARGGIGKTGRTLHQRLGDLKKMSPTNRGKEMARLKVEFEHASPVKKIKLDSLDPKTVLAPDMTPEMVIAEDGTVDPTKLRRRDTPQLPDGADLEAVLAQNRIDLALNEGAASNGPLLRRLASTPPQRTPPRKTRASALANSPTRVPVKSPHRLPPPVTPQRRTSKVTANRSPNSKQRLTTSVMPETPVPTSKLGENRTAMHWKPSEETHAAALRAFKTPDVCQDSCLTFDEDVNVSRQINKARGGEFKEEVVLVGMRFLVVG